MVYCIIQGVVGYNSKTNCIYFSEDCLDLASSVDHDEMPHYAAFHLSLHYCHITHLHAGVTGVKGLPQIMIIFAKTPTCLEL